MARHVARTILFIGLLCAESSAQTVPDLILHNGEIVTVDSNFSIQQAIAIADDRIVAVGTDAELLQLRGPETGVVDLAGKTVLPGLIDSHVHPTGAATFEFDHPVPEMETISDVLNYVASRARVLDEGQWIRISQVFITRLRDQRFPTRQELDMVAPNHPVYFRTGPDAALNSVALKLNGIDKDYQVPEGVAAKVERNPTTGEPTGVIRSAGSLIKMESSEVSPTREEKLELLRQLFRDYNSVGITSVSDRNANDGAIELYQALRANSELTCRLFLYYGVGTTGDIEQIIERIQRAAQHELHTENRELWLRGIKIFLDGGMLTGSAYMQQPWGVSTIYGISDPNYQGVRYVESERLYEICKTALAHDLQMTAHSVGDGAVQALVDAYAKIDREDFPVRSQRPCVTHCNFMTAEAIETMQRIGIVADLQPAWLWLDGKTLTNQFGEGRMTFFQPYRTLLDKDVTVGAGSDHMQKIGSFRSVNPYNPFLGMWITLVRQARGMSGLVHPEQIISRADAIRLYTINNAYLSFEEEHKGSLEPGKLADLIVLDTPILTCPLHEVKEIRVERTYLGGKVVYQK